MRTKPGTYTDRALRKAVKGVGTTGGIADSGLGVCFRINEPHLLGTGYAR